MNYERWMSENIDIPENDNVSERVRRLRHLEQRNSSYLELRKTQRRFDVTPCGAPAPEKRH
jgi:hypothetical protein